MPDAAFPGAGAARSPNERLISLVRRRADSEATPGPRAHAQLQHEPRMRNAMRVRARARGCAWAYTDTTTVVAYQIRTRVVLRTRVIALAGWIAGTLNVRFHGKLTGGVWVHQLKN